MEMPTVLVVDDNEKIVDVLSEYLRADSYQVLAAYDGTTALDLANKHHPDLALVDVMLPGYRRSRADAYVPVAGHSRHPRHRTL